MNTITAYAPRSSHDTTITPTASVGLLPIKKLAPAENGKEIKLAVQPKALTHERSRKERNYSSVELKVYGGLRDTVAAVIFDLPALGKSFICQEKQRKTSQGMQPANADLHSVDMHARSANTVSTSWGNERKPIRSCAVTERALRNCDGRTHDANDRSMGRARFIPTAKVGRPPPLSAVKTNETPALKGLAQRLYKVTTQGLGGRGGPEIARNWAQEKTQPQVPLAGWEILANARFHFANPTFSPEACTYLNHVMHEGILIEDAIEKELTPVNIELIVRAPLKDDYETVSSREMGFKNFVNYHGRCYLRYLDRLFLATGTQYPVKYFKVTSALTENKVLCLLAPKLKVNKNDSSKSVGLRAITLESLNKKIGNIRYYGIEDLKNGDENLYQYLKTSLRNARTLLRNARKRLSVTPVEKELEKQLQTFGIGNVAKARGKILKIIIGCDRYLASLEGTCGYRVIVMERLKNHSTKIATTLIGDPVKHMFLYESYFHSPTLEAAGTLIHEASHVMAKTDDLWYCKKPSRMTVVNEKLLHIFEYASLFDSKAQFKMNMASYQDILNNLTNEKAEKLINANILMRDNFVRFFKKKANSIDHNENGQYTIGQALHALNSDPALKTSAILHNAECISQIVILLASSSFFKGEFSLENPTEWVNKAWLADPENTLSFDTSLPDTSQASPR